MTSRSNTFDAQAPASQVKITRWRSAQNPTHAVIARLMEQEGLRPYGLTLTPNFRDGSKSHGYTKVLYCTEGSVEINLPDLNQKVTLRPGDRVELPRGTRHSIQVGGSGARVVESNVRVSGVRPVGV